MPLPKCSSLMCLDSGTQTLKIEMRLPNDPVLYPVIVRIPVCDKHKPTEEETKQFIDANWEHLCMGFESQGMDRPSRAETTYKWIPWLDAELFYSEQQGDALTKMRKQ